jgi:hypothetical protein
MRYPFKDWFAVVLVLFSLSWPGERAYTQAEVTAVDTLSIEIWPDYDRAAVLVLLTGTLPADTTLPARLTIPLPANAELNAVARITDDNLMTDDVEYTVSEEEVSFVTPDSRFRVEYYVPYTAVNKQHQFDFTWLADFSVAEMNMAIQQPIAATEMQTQPATSLAQDEADGFMYHVLPATAVPAKQPYTVSVEYTMSEPLLSVEQLPPVPAVTMPTAVNTPATNTSNNWPLWLAVIGGAMIVGALVWQVVSNRQKRARPGKPVPIRPPTRAARFCHECGNPLQAGDQFCRNCGTAVKGR